MESNKPVAPRDVEALRTELKRSEGTGTLFVGIWQLARYALATLEWADTLAQQVADQIGTIVDLRVQLRDAQEVAQELVMKAEQWQKQLEWHYQGFPAVGEEVTVVLTSIDSITAYEARRGMYSPGVNDWWIDGHGWLAKLPAMRVRCWQRINYPLEFQAQDKDSE